MSWMYRAGRVATRLCLTFFGRFEVTGQECVPPYGPLIIVSNHLSYNDPSVLFVGLPRPLSYLGKVELFSNPIKRTIMGWVSVFPLDRTTTGVDGIRTALNLLAQDRALVIFPEGRISLDKSLERAKGGAAFIAIKSQAPILPVAISGTEKFSPWRMLFPFRRYRITIGPPFTPPVLASRLRQPETLRCRRPRYESRRRRRAATRLFCETSEPRCWRRTRKDSGSDRPWSAPRSSRSAC